MKKFFMFAAMASVALVSCVKNEAGMGLAGSNDKVAISFEAPILAPSVKSVQEIVQFPVDKIPGNQNRKSRNIVEAGCG